MHERSLRINFDISEQNLEGLASTTTSCSKLGVSYLNSDMINLFDATCNSELISGITEFDPYASPLFDYNISDIYFDNGNIVYSKTNPSYLCDHIDYGIGVYKFSDFENTMESFDLSLIQERFSKLKKLQYYEAKKRFYEIGTPDSYKKAEEVFS